MSNIDTICVNLGIGLPEENKTAPIVSVEFDRESNGDEYAFTLKRGGLTRTGVTFPWHDPESMEVLDEAYKALGEVIQAAKDCSLVHEEEPGNE